MDQLFGWLQEPAFTGSFQIVLDLLLVLMVIFLFPYVKRAKKVSGAEQIAETMEKVIQDTRSIAEEFEGNLQQRQEMIQSLLGKLDAKIKEASELCRGLEKQCEDVQTAILKQENMPSHFEHQKIIILHQKGLDADAIAKRLQKPVGEVELILKLQRLSNP